MTKKKILPLFVIFNTSGFIYIMLELLWRGRSHWTMFVCAGLCGLVMANVNKVSLSMETFQFGTIVDCGEQFIFWVTKLI